MPKIASISQVILSVAVLAVMGAPALGAEPPPAAQPAPAAPSGPPKGFECHDKSLTGSGAGFKSSQEESEEAAKVNWLEKAKAIYPDADWATVKDPLMQCVKQGLYSKCFAMGFPCHPKPQ
ncbi:MAG: hypothetical protein H7X74_08180 [Methyloceanibacter sp.]|nr:hypothetical protein [Methyloceanibacter sp.]